MKQRTEPDRELREIVYRNGGTIYGVARVDSILEFFPLLSERLRSGMNYAISAGIKLSNRILDDLSDGPTHLYYFHYLRVNQSLDNIAVNLTNHIQMDGYNAVPIPASQTVDLDRQLGQLSHKAIALRAGHGWIGRNNLLVHPVHGSSIRYMTVLTDMPLKVDSPYDGDCGNCRRCIKPCPAGAISETSEAWDREACLRTLKEFSKKRNIRHHICGICVSKCRF
jgi:epoxyqueuosine reductase QueG